MGYALEQSVPTAWRHRTIVTLGLVLLILGLIFGSGVLWTIGIALVVIGALLWLLGSFGRAVGPRRHYY